MATEGSEVELRADAARRVSVNREFFQQASPSPARESTAAAKAPARRLN
jgi:hypothetical protein